MTGFLVSVLFLLLPRHLILTACFTMLFLLLLLEQARARVPLHEYFFHKQSHNKEFGADYSYVDAYSGHVTKASKDYAYEYKEPSDGFRSGAVNPEVGNF